MEDSNLMYYDTHLLLECGSQTETEVSVWLNADVQVSPQRHYQDGSSERVQMW